MKQGVEVPPVSRLRVMSTGRRRPIGQHPMAPFGQRIPHVAVLSAAMDGTNDAFPLEQIPIDQDFVGLYITARSTNQDWTFNLFNPDFAGHVLSKNDIFGPLNVNGESSYFPRDIVVPFAVPWLFPRGSNIQAQIIDSHAETVYLQVHGYYEQVVNPDDALQARADMAPDQWDRFQDSLVARYSRGLIDVPYVLDFSRSPSKNGLVFAGNGSDGATVKIPNDGDFFLQFLTGRASVAENYTLQLNNDVTGKTLSPSTPTFGPITVRGGSAGGASFFLGEGPTLEAEWKVRAGNSITDVVLNSGGAQTIKTYGHGYRRLRIITAPESVK